MAYGDFNDLLRGTAADKTLLEKAIILLKNPRYDGFRRALASMIYNFFDKKTAVGAVKMKN